MTLANMDKATMLKLVHEGWQAFEAALAQFDDGQMAQAQPPDGWSVKDMLVHISRWEIYPLQRLQEAHGGEKPNLSPSLSDDQLNQINEDLLAAGRARSLAEVKADWQRVHQELVAELERIPDNHDDPWWGLWPSPEMPWRVIFGDTNDHYAEHLRDLRTWLARD